MALDDDGNHTELGTDGDRAIEEGGDSLGRRGRDNVKIGGLAPEQQIAHDPTDQIGFPPTGAQPPDNLEPWPEAIGNGPRDDG
jgi:hypothetical protein